MATKLTHSNWDTVQRALDRAQKGQHCLGFDVDDLLCMAKAAEAVLAGHGLPPRERVGAMAVWYDVDPSKSHERYSLSTRLHIRRGTVHWFVDEIELIETSPNTIGRRTLHLSDRQIEYLTAKLREIKPF